MSTATLSAPQTKRRVMLRPGEVGRRLGVSPKMVKDWGATGKIHRAEDPSHRGYFLYDLVGARVFHRSRKVFDGEPTNELVYDGQRMLWIDKLLDDPWQENYHVSPQSLREWDEPDGVGCFTLGGEKPGLVELWFKNRPRPRLYVPIDFLDRYVKARQKELRHAPAADGSPGPGRVWLSDAVKMRFPLELLMRHTKYASPHRDRSRKKGRRSRPLPVPHPYLGRFIKSGLARVSNIRADGNGLSGPPRRPWVDLADLNRLKDAPPPNPKFWLDREGVRRTGFKPSGLPSYEGGTLRRLDGEQLKTDWFWISSRGRMVKHWWSAHIEKLVEDLPKPATYIHTDPDGEQLVPVSRGAREADVPVMDLFHCINKPNPEWGGIKVRGRPIPVKLHKVAQDELMFVNLGDCVAVGKFRRGEKAAPAAAPTGPASLPATNPLPAQRLTMHDDVAILDNTPYPLSASFARIVRILLAARGAAVSRGELKVNPNSGERPDKIIRAKGNPKEIRSLIASSFGNTGGYRLLPKAFAPPMCP